MSASFPSATWNGQSSSRSNSSVVRPPDPEDWQRIINEVAAIQSFLRTNFQTAPNDAAIIQSDSTTQGWLPPRMTSTQRDAIATPPEGLVIYNTSTHTLNVYNGTAWKAVTIA